MSPVTICLMQDFNLASVAELQVLANFHADHKRGLVHDMQDSQVISDMRTHADWWQGYFRFVEGHMRNDPLFSARVAIQQNQVIGAVMTVPGKYAGHPDAGKIDSLCVHPDHWGQGVGRRLMDDAILHIRQCGMHRAVLMTEENNVLTKAFYRKLGWRKIQGEFSMGEQNGRLVKAVTYEKKL